MVDAPVQWKPSLGAWPEADGTGFRVWAPEAETVEVVSGRAKGPEGVFPLRKAADGTFGGRISGIRAGALYRYRVDGRGPFPDPASRFQPEGVHGPSEVVDPGAFSWSDRGWKGIPLERLVFYELHVGTFTPSGTFAGLLERLPRLSDLGVTAVELMPVAEFSGTRNWGYDGVDLFAPFHGYGRPNDLRRFVDRAHALGMAVILDVVYNHLGPDGNYLREFSRHYFSERHETAWGEALNFDGEGSRGVREFFIENALHWIHEYHVDGLRLDATHAIVDRGPKHLLTESAERVRAVTPGRRTLLIAEDHRNLARLIRASDEGGWDLDAVWADDFHHQLRRRLAGDHEGYYRDFTASMEGVATALRRGWIFCGRRSQHFGGRRGTDPSGIPLFRFVHCLQNHDQVGNRAFGERLHHQIDAPAYRAATVLLLTAPSTPLLFMGQEWAAKTPFLYFTDHEPSLGEEVTRGRRKEFKDFSDFSRPEERRRIPDPQSLDTFLRSRLDWNESEAREHQRVLCLYRDLLRLRRTEPALRFADNFSGRDGKAPQGPFEVAVLDEDTIGLRRTDGGRSLLLVLVHLPDHDSTASPGGGRLVRTDDLLSGTSASDWRIVLSTEDERFDSDPRPPELDLSGERPSVAFRRPSAVILKGVTS